eukprot:1542301-Amphidinium_carterae.2
MHCEGELVWRHGKNSNHNEMADIQAAERSCTLPATVPSGDTRLCVFNCQSFSRALIILIVGNSQGFQEVRYRQ